MLAPPRHPLAGRKLAAHPLVDHPQTYRPPAWLPGAHLQTIWPARFSPCPSVQYRRERWGTPDGDFIDVDFLRSAPSARSAPLLVLFHGLEGCSRSHYALSIVAAAGRRGWRAAVPHFRGCSGELNRAPRAYHSGDSPELDWILRRFAREHVHGAPLLVIGVSIGGNVLLKWLGEQGAAARFVRAAVAVSPPQDLHVGALALSRGFNRVYTLNFMTTLKRKSLAKLAQYPGLYDRQEMLRARDFYEFDDAVTAPMHGFASCFDYWERSSCRPFLSGIGVRSLVINALNDPFLPRSALASRDEVSAEVTLEYPAEGGHVGFIQGRPPGHHEWLPARAIDWLSQGLVDG